GDAELRAVGDDRLLGLAAAIGIENVECEVVPFEQAGLVADLGHEGFADAAAADRNLELIVSASRFDASDEGCEQRDCKCATPHWFLPQAAKVPRPILQPHGQERIE